MDLCVSHNLAATSSGFFNLIELGFSDFTSLGSEKLKSVPIPTVRLSRLSRPLVSIVGAAAVRPQQDGRVLRRPESVRFGEQWEFLILKPAHFQGGPQYKNQARSLWQLMVTAAGDTPPLWMLVPCKKLDGRRIDRY